MTRRQVRWRRRCQVVAPCCGQVHACRYCHDEAEDHRLDPHAVTSMVCMACNLRQPAAGAPFRLRFQPRMSLDGYMSD